MDKAKQKAIIFTGIAIILFYWCIGNLSTIGNWLQYVLGLVSPFILGGAIAFIVNVPMRNIEKKLFQGKCGKADSHKKHTQGAYTAGGGGKDPADHIGQFQTADAEDCTQ